MRAAGELNLGGRAPGLRQRPAALRLALLRTVGGWALCDAHDRTVYEADGADARRACLARGLELGAVCLRAGDEMCRRPRETPARPSVSGGSRAR
jgi:hypothetical protein